MKKPPLFLSLLVLCTAVFLPAWAEKADRDKTMIINADNLRHDEVKQISTYSGNLVITKGSILIQAARIDVRMSADGYQSAVITGTPDKLAFFRQKRDAVDEFIEVESERIDYNGSVDVVKFTGKAQLRRLRGAELADEISGAVIVYENLTDKFSVDGSSSAGSPGVTPAPGGRVRAMLTPKPAAAASAIPAAKIPAQPSPTLRPSTTLGSTPQ